MQWIKIRELSILDIGDFYHLSGSIFSFGGSAGGRGRVDCVNMTQRDLRPQTWAVYQVVICPSVPPSPTTSINQIFSTSCWQIADTPTLRKIPQCLSQTNHNHFKINSWGPQTLLSINQRYFQFLVISFKELENGQQLLK